MQAVILDASDGKDSELSPSSESDATCQATEDEDYYLYFVTFEVEDRLFRVPSYQFFDESPEFVEIYKLSTHLRADDGEPIKLEMVTQEDFRSLLKVLYPLHTTFSLIIDKSLPPAEPVMRLPSLSKEGWVSVLTLASRWRFLRVRLVAKITLERLFSLSSLEKIYIGRDLSIPSWVIDGFVGLVQATTITDDEALQIDSDAETRTTAYKLFRIRELRTAGPGELRTKVEEIFKEELDRLRTTEEMLSLSNTNE